MQSVNTDNNYKMLAMAIIQSAMNDYLTQGKAVAMRKKDWRTCKSVVSLRNFFYSQWGELLIGIVSNDLTAESIVDKLDHKIEAFVEKNNLL